MLSLQAFPRNLQQSEMNFRYNELMYILSFGNKFLRNLDLIVHVNVKRKERSTKLGKNCRY